MYVLFHFSFVFNRKSHPGQVYAALHEIECGKGGASDGAPALGLVKGELKTAPIHHIAPMDAMFLHCPGLAAISICVRVVFVETSFKHTEDILKIIIFTKEYYTL